MLKSQVGIHEQTAAMTLAVVGVLVGAAWSLTPEDDIAETLVKVYTISNPRDHASPWQRSGTAQSGGFGVIIEGKRILTCPHVVANHVSVEVKRFGSTNRLRAEEMYSGHDCDLANPTVSDSTFFEGVWPAVTRQAPGNPTESRRIRFPTRR